MEGYTSGEVSLRSFHASDAEDFMSWAGDDDVTRFTMWDTYTSIDKAKDFLETVAIPSPWFKAICLDGVPIGSLSLNQGTGADCCRAELGYVLRKKHWGKGFTTEAVKLALVQGFKELDIERIEAFVFPDNKASQKVLQKAGFVQEAVLRKYRFAKGIVHDCLVFSYIKSS
eukprot:c15377_g1_i1 orf=112-624(+)